MKKIDILLIVALLSNVCLSGVVSDNIFQEEYSDKQTHNVLTRAQAPETLPQACSTAVPLYLASVYEKILVVWKRFDFLRSIAIKKEHRSEFVRTIRPDVIHLLEDLSALSNTFYFCKAYYHTGNEKLQQIGALYGGMLEAFNATFSPIRTPEEEWLLKLLLCSGKKIVGLQQNLKLGS